MKFFTRSVLKNKHTTQIIRTMKISVFLLLVAIFPVIANNAYSQDTEIAFKQKNISLESVIQKIEASTNYRFLYRTEQIDMQQRVNVSVEKTSVIKILNELANSNNFNFKILDHNLIVLSPNKLAAKFKVTGTVVSAKSFETLIGVTVKEKGTSTATVTDVNGAFTIFVSSPKAILEVSYMGFEKQEIAVNNTSQFTIKLVESIKTLDEVVVVGYGSQKKVTVVGAITSISTKELRQSPTTNLSNALAGRMSGMMVNQFSGGEPGVDQSSVFVRGMSTYNTGNNAQSPIVIVDGIERDFQYLNPEEVETFSILKDASSTAVYGIRGANGVILVTTRRGKQMEKANVTFKASTGVSSPIKFPDYLGSADYATLYNEARLNDDPKTTSALFSQAQIANYRKAKGDNSDGLGYNTNLFDYAFKPSMQQDYSLNIQGGTKTVKYFVLAGYMNQNGNYQHTNDGPQNTNAVFKRYNFRSNIDINITDDFYVKLNLGGRIQNRIAPGTTASRVITIANTQPSIYPVILQNNDNPANAKYEAKHPEGLLFGSQLYRYNMLGELAYSGFINEYKTFMDGSFVMGHKLDFITKGLTSEVQFSYDIQAGNTVDRTIPHESEGYREYGGYATFYPSAGVDVFMNGGNYTGAYVSPRRTDNNSMNNGYNASTPPPQRKNDVQASLNYARSFGQNNISALLLIRQSTRTYQNDVPYATQGTAFRATYNYAEKYLFEVNTAYNGSENFAKGHRYGLFPAVALGWVASNESFLKNNSFIDYLKIRGSFGLVGSDQLPGNRFGFLQFFTVDGNSYNFGTTQNSSAPANVYEGSLANPALTWEKSKKYNAGIETKILNNRLSFTADVFFEHRYDILTQPGDNGVKSLSAVVGQNSPQLNLGIVDNKGIDLEIGWNDNIGKDFSYYIRPNFSFARNKIKFMNEIDRIAPDGKPVPYAARTGKRIGEQFVYQFDHFVKDQAEADKLNAAVYQPWGKLIPGDCVYKDQNGDGKITDQEDRIAMGNPRNPEIQFGIPMGISYKGFDLSLLFQGATLCSIELTDAAAWDFPTYGQDIIGRVKDLHLNRWTPATAATASYPALHYGPYPNNKNSQSSLFLADASYIRLKSMEIGYSISPNALRKIGFSKTRFYVQGLNLLTWDKLKKYDVDPETNTGGDWYPIQRVISFGVDVTF
ncbi:MAG: TonB-dependent receptor [Bacteroidetes bacterium]|nr:TonB-dependent receptor [Bacteroidota bacterium]